MLLLGLSGDILKHSMLLQAFKGTLGHSSRSLKGFLGHLMLHLGTQEYSKFKGFSRTLTQGNHRAGESKALECLFIQ